jgi:toxin ParE1/3/4
VKLSLHPLAASDLAAAAAYYRQQGSPALESRFLDEFERVIRLLMTQPLIGSPAGLPRRSFPLRHFPYSVMYRPGDDDLRILVVRHQRRAPAFGGGRH